MLNYLDLFAGAGGLSEGFARVGYRPLAHIEMDEAACFTLKTRLAFNYLKNNQKDSIYNCYLKGEIDRQFLYSKVPEQLLNSVLNYEISVRNLSRIFGEVDNRLEGQHLDLIIGGPPCQAYSLVGRARDENSMTGDKRNYLYVLYAEFLKRYRPKYFVFENVIGLLSAKDIDGKLHFIKMQDLFSSIGYSIEYDVLNAKDYGVLQNRKRIILIGKLGNHSKFYPNIPKGHFDCLVREIFTDLPKVKSGEGEWFAVKTSHYYGEYLYAAGIKSYDRESVTQQCSRPNTEQDLEIYNRVVMSWNKERKRLRYNDLPDRLRSQKNITSFCDRFKVVADNLPYSQTVVAHMSKDGHYFIHPDINQNRSLTPREAARLQTFPDNYYFESVSGKPSRTAAYRQIGNAVPVLLAEKIAKTLLEVW
ncbi:DNA (cytosine-5-)-methyltransferase [Scardovia wiggsiae F0424]|uniref:Cytosine-specific methyltransferase n=1 Tax=Scardovia wiggsiae F0424 TaxID=857290 RepID=J0DGR6_9BIFI|nr:DNA cytosine methyltransferase [Scardovia wiggsiae]EJD65523.1 DNA (cytosine-5-)-methyltransferase [Scardovia wiggsiae F0424]